jgi:hypothetical protein
MYYRDLISHCGRIGIDLLTENLIAIASDPLCRVDVKHPCIGWVLFSASGRSSDAATESYQACSDVDRVNNRKRQSESGQNLWSEVQNVRCERGAMGGIWLSHCIRTFDW